MRDTANVVLLLIVLAFGCGILIGHLATDTVATAAEIMADRQLP